ncbi:MULTISPECIES: helix-turn-helix domain-containing protein [Natrinema]|uniref:Bacterio-opsin activator HTH domain protein n=1 Tax=Natrinema gari JCM 14663 TaxID=1230459 RepID=L9Z392_9EURY|nr:MULTISPECIES: helix-turn-helix domain-containing protein [Natrinema]AFO57479.1 Bacterio-opsin activator HTH domain protein [Natrinema sp. J7-2]ELY80975.1 Bacterio-opsin activator HTH domain protein [Natrinema gari JCM 14663]
MKTVRLTLRYDAATIHPMHRFVAESDAFDAYRMVHGNFAGDDDNAFIFHVVGDPDVYEAALADTGRVSDYELTRTGDRTFTVYVRDLPAEVDARLLDLFTERSLVVLPPVEYRSDWTVRFSVVGDSDDLRRVLEGIPDGIETTVDRVGEYDGGDAAVGALTARQRETLRVARELGYFDVPRSAGVEDVAAKLDCAPGTAAEHLRKAEAAVMEALEL